MICHDNLRITNYVHFALFRFQWSTTEDTRCQYFVTPSVSLLLPEQRYIISTVAMSCVRNQICDEATQSENTSHSLLSDVTLDLSQIASRLHIRPCTPGIKSTTHPTDPLYRAITNILVKKRPLASNNSIVESSKTVKQSHCTNKSIKYSFHITMPPSKVHPATHAQFGTLNLFLFLISHRPVDTIHLHSYVRKPANYLLSIQRIKICASKMFKTVSNKARSSPVTQIARSASTTGPSHATNTSRAAADRLRATGNGDSDGDFQLEDIPLNDTLPTTQSREAQAPRSTLHESWPRPRNSIPSDSLNRGAKPNTGRAYVQGLQMIDLEAAVRDTRPVERSWWRKGWGLWFWAGLVVCVCVGAVVGEEGVREESCSSRGRFVLM